MRFFDSGIFNQRTSPSSVRHVQKGFCIYSEIRGVIHIRNQLANVFTTGESRLPGVFATEVS